MNLLKSLFPTLSIFYWQTVAQVVSCLRVWFHFGALPLDRLFKTTSTHTRNEHLRASKTRLKKTGPLKTELKYIIRAQKHNITAKECGSWFFRQDIDKIRLLARSIGFFSLAGSILFLFLFLVSYLCLSIGNCRPGSQQWSRMFLLGSSWEPTWNRSWQSSGTDLSCAIVFVTSLLGLWMLETWGSSSAQRISRATFAHITHLPVVVVVAVVDVVPVAPLIQLGGVTGWLRSRRRRRSRVIVEKWTLGWLQNWIRNHISSAASQEEASSITEPLQCALADHLFYCAA